MREKILAQLAAKWPGVSKKFLGLWADKLVPKVTEESQIQGVIDELEKLPVPITDLATEYQKEGDRRVTEAEAAWKKKVPAPADPGKTDPDPKDPPPDDMPAWAKQLMGAVTALQKDRTHTSMASRMAEKLKDVPAGFYKGRALPDKEEDFETFVESVQKDWTDFRQEQITAGLMTQTPPAGGSGGTNPPANNSKVVDADIAAWAQKGKTAVTEDKK
jgi:hypothetical protein